MPLRNIKIFLKRFLPASYRNIDLAQSRILESLDWLRSEIQSLHSEINELEKKNQKANNDYRNSISEKIDSVWQKIEDEANWKRDELNVKIDSVWQKVQDEANWKRHDIQKAMDESKYRLKNIENIVSIDFYNSLKEERESKLDFEKRMLIHLPKSICSYMHERNMYMEEVVHVLLWDHSEIPFEDLDYTWRYLIENSNTSSWILFEHYTRFLFQHGDLLDNLENVYHSKIHEFEKWTPICKLSYISFLYYQDHEEQAVEILKDYMAQYGEEKLEHFIPVAFLAKKHFGISNDSVILSATRFETMKNNNGFFEKLVSTGSIALVGNGPQEKGKLSGSKIDSHALVLRFNSYNLSEEFHADYGKKVTIWANCGNIPVDNCKKGNFKYFMYLPGIYDEPIDNRFLDDFENAFTVDMLALRKVIYKKTGLYCTSNGFNLIFAIKKLNKDFSVNDCFGFSFKDEVISDRWMHYDGIELKGVHSLQDEKNEIEKIFNQELHI